MQIAVKHPSMTLSSGVVRRESDSKSVCFVVVSAGMWCGSVRSSSPVAVQAYQEPCFSVLMPTGSFAEVTEKY